MKIEKNIVLIFVDRLFDDGEENWYITFTGKAANLTDVKCYRILDH